MNKINATKQKVSDMGDLNEILDLVNEMDEKNKLLECFNASYFCERYGYKIILEGDLDAYILRCRSCRKIKKMIMTHIDAYHSFVLINRCEKFFGDSEWFRCINNLESQYWDAFLLAGMTDKWYFLFIMGSKPHLWYYSL